jgi:hypothetical protein
MYFSGDELYRYYRYSKHSFDQVLENNYQQCDSIPAFGSKFEKLLLLPPTHITPR